MIKSVPVFTGAPTTAEASWTPQVNGVSYDRATYVSDTADGHYGDEAASRVAERVDRAAAAQTQGKQERR